MWSTVGGQVWPRSEEIDLNLQRRLHRHCQYIIGRWRQNIFRTSMDYFDVL